MWFSRNTSCTNITLIVMKDDTEISSRVCWTQITHPARYLCVNEKINYQQCHLMQSIIFKNPIEKI